MPQRTRAESADRSNQELAEDAIQFRDRVEVRTRNMSLVDLKKTCFMYPADPKKYSGELVVPPLGFESFEAQFQKYPDKVRLALSGLSLSSNPFQ